MNLPNALSLLRLIMVPVFVWVFFSDLPNAHRIAGIIFLAAAFTDMLDGRIARKYNLITRLGRVLDPLADKLMTGAALICLVVADIVPLWIVIVFAAKEVTMGVGSLVLYKHIEDVPPSNYVGKTATVVFFASCLVMMLFDIPKTAATIIMSVALALTVLALAIYGLNMLKLIRSHRKNTKTN